MEWARRIILSKNKMFLAFCFCFLFGVAFASIAETSPRHIFVLYFLLLVLIFTAGVFWKNKSARFFILTVFCFVFGLISYGIALPPIDRVLPDGISSFTGFIAADPDIRVDSVRYIVKTSDESIGRVYVRTNLYPQYKYGDKLKVACKLKTPEAFEDFRYDMYMALFNVFTICEHPEIAKTGGGGGNFIMRHILFFKDSVALRVYYLWPEPYASFMAGLLYGYRGGLGDLQDAFSRVGISHIVAISGYNITIIASILMTALSYIRIRRQRAFYIVCAGVFAFTVLVGASPSVVRAAVMGLLALSARQIGRVTRPINLIVCAAVFMVFMNPFVLLWDAGFQLSFLATIGLLYFSPIAERLIEPYWNRRLMFFRDSSIQTLSAIIATLPLILYQFGRLSLVAPIVNILTLWTIPYIMLVGALAIFIDSFFPFIGIMIAWIGWVGMEYILKIVYMFNSLPFAAIDFSIPWWVLVFAYGFLFWLYYFCYKKIKRPVIPKV